MRIAASFFALSSIIFMPIRLQAQSWDGYGLPAAQPFWQVDNHEHIYWCFIAAVSGIALGVLFSDKLRKFRVALYLFLFAFSVIWALFMPGIGEVVSFVVGFFVAYHALSDKQKQTLRAKLMGRFKRIPQTVFGTATWAALEYLQFYGLTENKGFFLGTFRHRLSDGTVETVPLHYNGDRHLLTVAPTRAGKGVSSIVPNLLTYSGSALVIDPKGENALVTAAHRGKGNEKSKIPGLGQDIKIVDPWGIVANKKAAARYNPLDWLKPGDEDINENAMILWDGIVVPRSTGETFWDEEAKALGVGLTLHVAIAKSEKDNRNLGRVRDIIVMGQSDFFQILNEMLASENPVVRSTAMRTATKEERLLSSVMATLQAHTHFLDSPRIRESLSRSDFKFEDLKTKKMTVYLVLPADRLNTFGRWLRLLVQQAITVNARNIAEKPEKPILFMLDEMPALGRLTMVEQAYGLMAGFGMQLWGIVQDLSQLEHIYGKSWETFIGNSGVLQYYGSHDLKSAEYFSKLAGMTTVRKFSWTSGISRALGLSTSSGTNSSYSSSSSFSSGAGGGSSGSSSSTTTGSSFSVSESISDTESDSESMDVVQRPLIMPDELMVMRRDESLLLVENLNPIKAFKVRWFDDLALKSVGVELYPSTEKAE